MSDEVSHLLAEELNYYEERVEILCDALDEVLEPIVINDEVNHA